MNATRRHAARKRKRPRGWFVYILQCADGTYYVGITTDLQRRLAMHNAGTASRYTRARLPVRLRYAERQPSQSAALVRELAIKRRPRAQKTALIRSSTNLLPMAGRHLNPLPARKASMSSASPSPRTAGRGPG